MKILSGLNNFKIENKSKTLNLNNDVQPISTPDNCKISEVRVNKNILCQFVSFNGKRKKHKISREKIEKHYQPPIKEAEIKQTQKKVRTPEEQGKLFEKIKYMGFNEKIVDQVKLYEFKIDLNHPEIKKAIETLKNSTATLKSTEEKIDKISSYVDFVFSRESVANRLKITEKYYNDFCNTGNILDFGELVGKGTGVCRHRAVLFKLLCDYLFDGDDPHRPRASLVRGDKGGLHAWNVIKYIDSQGSPRSMVVDHNIKYPIDEYANPRSNSPEIRKYGTRQNNYKYYRDENGQLKCKVLQYKEFRQAYYNGKIVSKPMKNKNYFGQKLENELFQGKVIQNTSFERVTFNESNLSNSQIFNCDFSSSKLFLLDYTGAEINSSNFYKANSSSVNFSSASMTNVDFSYSGLYRTIFDYSTLENCKFNNAKGSLSGYKQSILINCNFANSNLQADFTYAKLIDCNFTGADLFNSNLKEAQISGSRFDNCIISKSEYESNHYFMDNYRYIDSYDLSDRERKSYNINKVVGVGILKPIAKKD